jgi:hypothetical protein
MLVGLGMSFKDLRSIQKARERAWTSVYRPQWSRRGHRRVSAIAGVQAHAAIAAIFTTLTIWYIVCFLDNATAS